MDSGKASIAQLGSVIAKASFCSSSIECDGLVLWLKLILRSVLPRLTK